MRTVIAGIPTLVTTLGLMLVTGGCGEQHVAEQSGSNPLMVRTESGLVEGLDAGRAEQFLGIPFAAPPVGELRWKPPAPVTPWPDVLDAVTLPVACAQLQSSNGPGSDAEDCLYLSIYRPPQAHAGDGLPVLIWIHGGGATNGSGNQFDASSLAADTGTVVVTINYRLTVFGFLALPALTAEAEDHSSGNLGLLDQQAAMRWVQHNIAAFGGNPANVTISGESAGGAAVCFHLASPTAKGLFQRAVIQSGAFVIPPGASALLGGGNSVEPCGAATLAQAEQAGSKFAASVGCTDPDTAATCLRAKSPTELLAASASFGAGINISGTALPEKVLPAIQAGRWNRVPVMIGTTHDELQIAAGIFPGGVSNPAVYAAAVSFVFGSARTKDIIAEYPASDYPSPGLALGALLTDAALACPTDTVRRLLAGLTDTYGFEFDDPNAPPGVQNGVPSGAYHSSDVHYLFDYTPYQGPTTAAQDALAEQMQRYWGAFAELGRPQTAEDPAWPRFDPQEPQVMSLRPDGSVLIDDFAEFHHCSFWDNLAQ